jgi:hypothetical protein
MSAVLSALLLSLIVLAPSAAAATSSCAYPPPAGTPPPPTSPTGTVSAPWTSAVATGAAACAGAGGPDLLTSGAAACTGAPALAGTDVWCGPVQTSLPGGGYPSALTVKCSVYPPTSPAYTMTGIAVAWDTAGAPFPGAMVPPAGSGGPPGTVGAPDGFIDGWDVVYMPGGGGVQSTTLASGGFTAMPYPPFFPPVAPMATTYAQAIVFPILTAGPLAGLLPPGTVTVGCI